MNAVLIILVFAVLMLPVAYALNRISDRHERNKRRGVWREVGGGESGEGSSDGSGHSHGGCGGGHGGCGGGQPLRTRTVLTAGYASLVAKFNAGVGRSVQRTCDGGGLARTYTLDFRYPSRRTVTITIEPDCHPSIHNGHGLDTDNVDAVLTAAQPPHRVARRFHLRGAGRSRLTRMSRLRPCDSALTTAFLVGGSSGKPQDALYHR